MPDNRYLILRRRTWYIRVAVSPAVARAIGKHHIVRTLKTRDVKVARERRWAALAEIKAWISDQDGGTWLGDWLPAKFDPMSLALEHREWWLSSSTEPDDARDPRSPNDRTTAEFVIGDYAEEIATKRGDEVARQYYRIAKPGGPDQKRSWYVSKRFTIYRRAILSDSREVDFHSFRRCFATYLERAQSISGAVYRSVIDELMGHKKQTLALSLYSGGLRRDHLQAAVGAMIGAIEPEVLDAAGTTPRP